MLDINVTYRNSYIFTELNRKDNDFLKKNPFNRINLVYLLECQEALGMENNAISNGHISASSTYNPDSLTAFNGRLNFIEAKGAWRAAHDDANQWLQVDLGSLYTKVTGVATQGRHTRPQWVTKYKLQSSDDEMNFQNYRGQGQNRDRVKYDYHN